MVPGVEERHAAAGLAFGEVDLDAQRPQQFDHGHAHLGEEHVPQAGDHDRSLHALAPPGPCGGGGATTTSTSSGPAPSLIRPCSTPAGATSASPASSRCSAPEREKRPAPSST